MKQKLNHEDSKFEKISLSLEDYRKSKVHSDEIELNGEMYDVKSVNYIGDRVELMVIHDKHETGIIKKIKSALKGGSENSTTIPSNYFKLLNLQYIIPDAYKLSFPVTIKLIYCKSVDSLIENVIEVVSPPPRFI